MHSPSHTLSNPSLNPGPLPKPYLQITKMGNKLLTDNLEDSIIITSHNGTVKRLSPPPSKLQKEKVSIHLLRFNVLWFNDDITIHLSYAKFPELAVLAFLLYWRVNSVIVTLIPHPFHSFSLVFMVEQELIGCRLNRLRRGRSGLIYLLRKLRQVLNEI